MKKTFILLIIVGAIWLAAFSVNAQPSVVDETNIYISIGETLFNFNGPIEILENADFKNDSIIFSVPPEISFELSTAEERDLTLSSPELGTINCESGDNKISINASESLSPVLITITVNEGKCLPTNQSILSTFEEFKSSPVAQRVVREIIVPISITVTAVSAGTLIVTASVGSASFAFNITQILQQLGIFRFYALGLLRFRRKKPWGRVVERFSGKPLRGVLVQIYEVEFKKIKDAQLTDADGRFSALITPGKYYVKGSKAGFETQEMGPISIMSPDSVLDLELNLAPQTTEAALSYVKRLNILHVMKRFLDLINPYLLIFGTLISLGAMVIIPNILNYIGFIIYIILDILKIYFAKSYVKPFGRVIDASNQNAIALAIIRIFESERHLLLSTKVTDVGGHFNFLLSPGKYYLTCAKAGYTPFQSEEFLLKKSGVATLDIALKRV